MPDYSHLGVTGILAIALVSLILKFLERRERANAKEHMNGHSRRPVSELEDRHVEAIETIATQCTIQTELLRDIHKQTCENGKILTRADAKLEMLIH